MGLDDCGKRLILSFSKDDPGYHKPIDILMVIKSPRGTLVLFDDGDQKKQCRAIKKFMEEHIYDKG